MVPLSRDVTALVLHYLHPIFLSPTGRDLPWELQLSSWDEVVSRASLPPSQDIVSAGETHTAECPDWEVPLFLASYGRCEDERHRGKHFVCRVYRGLHSRVETPPPTPAVCQILACFFFL